MKNWWQNLTVREKKTLTIGGSVLALIAVYLLIWQPFTKQIHTMQNDIAWQQELLTWMQANSKQIAQLTKAKQPSRSISSESLLSVIDEALQQTNLAVFVKEIAQNEQDKVTVTFNKVPFDQFIAWLTQLWQQHHIRVVQLHISAKEKTGVVQATLTLQAY